MTNLELLNLTALRSARIVREPYSWALIKNTFTSRDIAFKLAETFPTEGYRHFSRETGQKCHNLYGCRLFALNQEKLYIPQFNSLSDIWVQLANELISDNYREALSEVSGISLDGLQIEATLWRNSRGCFIDPHPDKPEKILTHLFYFNDADWNPNFGGCLRILKSSDIDDFVCEILPIIDTSVFFIRSDNSWHGYKKICASDCFRLALQVIFYREGLRYFS